MENALETRILEWLAAGPMVLPDLIEQAGCPVAELLTTLRAMGTAGALKASRVHRGQVGLGPVWWHLPAHQAPRPRARMKAEPQPAAVALLVAMGGHDDDDTPKAPQEVVERLGGTTTYREPCGSFGGTPALTADEIDFVLATAEDNDHVRHDRLARVLAYAVAMHSLRDWPEVQARGVPHLLRAYGNSRMCRPLVRGEHRIRVRFVLWDAFHGLVTNRPPPIGVRAAAARMRAASYWWLYRLAFDELSALADAVMGDAVKMLRDDSLKAA